VKISLNINNSNN
jgi:26S proteasome regulatory subunit T1